MLELTVDKFRIVDRLHRFSRIRIKRAHVEDGALEVYESLS